jgi:tetratricopeptide (TPR) repeat protein
MPYFLVHGARVDTAEACSFIQIAPTAEEAAQIVQGKGVFTSGAVQLDDGSQDSLADAGNGPSDLLRLGTRLDHDKRTDEAIFVMRYILREHPEPEAAIRIGRYLRRAGRLDEAWKYLNKLKVTGYDPHPIERLGFHCYPDLYKELAEICETEGKHKRYQFFMAVSRIVFTCQIFLGRRLFKEGASWYELDMDPDTKRDWKQESCDVLEALYGSRQRANEVLKPILKRKKREQYDWFVQRAVTMEETLAKAMEQ